MKRVGMNPVLGVVIPCFNEEEVIPHLLHELERFGRSTASPLRVLFVDDGSRDLTFELLRGACEKDSRYACLRLSRNFGHQAAVSAGLQFVRGDVVAVMDADLQDPLDVLPEMLAKWKDGFDVVYGIRRARKEGLLLRSCYSIFYRLLRGMANVEIPVDSGDFSLMDRKVVGFLNSMPEHNRFVRGMRGWIGFTQVGIPYDRECRREGVPKYNFKRLTRLALDGMISFSTIPLRLAIWIGFIASVFGMVLLVWVVANKFLHPSIQTGWASLAVIMLFFGGVQLLVMGILGEYIGRIFDEVKRRPNYIVMDEVGWLNTPESRQ